MNQDDIVRGSFESPTADTERLSGIGVLSAIWIISL